MTAATRGQHYIPRLLLRGFSSRRAGDECYTWMFRRATKPFETNIVNVGKERDFHGDPRTSTLEGVIAERESRYARLVASLREGIIDDLELLVEFVGSLALRTKNTREQLARMGASAVDYSEKFLTTPAGKRHLECELLEQVVNEPAVRRALMMLPPRQRKLMKRMITAKIRSGDWQNQSGGFFQALRTQVDIPAIVVNAQRKALLQDGAPPARVQSLRSFNWSVVIVSEPLILGDIAAIAFTASLGYHSAARLEEDTNAVLLPVASHALVIGTRAHRAFALPATAEINAASAEVSTEFFVSHVADDRAVALQTLIGTKPIFTEEEMDTTFS